MIENTNLTMDSTSTEGQNETCFYSHVVGLSFANENPIAGNPVIVKRLAELREKNPDNVIRENGYTSFSVDTHDLAHFLHLVYGETPDGRKVQASFDGIWPFEAPDEDGKMQKFNMQLVTLMEVDE